MVYGTLKKGFHNHRLLETATFEGPAVTQGTLYVNGLPYFRKEGSGYVYGELYRVDDATLERLDRLEGYNKSNPAASFYNRIEVDVLLTPEEGSDMYHDPLETTYVYEYNGTLHDKYIVTDGVYNG